MTSQLVVTSPEQRKEALNISRQAFTLFRAENLKQIETYSLKLSAIQEVNKDNIAQIKQLIKEERKLRKEYEAERLRYTKKIEEYADGIRAQEKSDWAQVEEEDLRVTMLADEYTRQEVLRQEAERKKIENEARKNADIEAVKIQLRTLFVTSQSDRVNEERILIDKTLKTIATAEEFDRRIKGMVGYTPRLQQADFISRLTSRLKYSFVNEDEVSGLVREFIEQDLYNFETWSGLVLSKVSDLKQEYVKISGSYKEKLEELSKAAIEKAAVIAYEANKEAERKISEAKINENVKSQAIVQSLPTISSSGQVRAHITGTVDWQAICERYYEINGIGKLDFLLTFLVKQNCPEISGIEYKKDIKTNMRGK